MVPDEAQIIRKAATDILDRGISIKAIVRELRENSVPTSRGGQWNGRNLKQVLTKPTVAGLAPYKGQLRPAPWPAILERDVWERLCEKLNSVPADANRGNEPKYLLSGIARCGICNDGTTVKVNGSGTLRGKKGYQCEKVAHIHRNMEHVDAMVEEVIIRCLGLHAKDILKPPARTGIDVSALRAEARKLRERKEAQIRMHALGDLTDDELTTGMRTIRDRLSVVEAQIHAATEPDRLAEFRDAPAETVWNSLPLARKRAVVKLLVEVTFLPATRRGPGFDPDAVQVTWRPG